LELPGPSVGFGRQAEKEDVMATTPEIDGRPDRPNPRRIQFPWLLALVVLVGVIGIALSFDSDRSLSERNGVLSQIDADNDVIPSIAPQ